MRGSRLGRSDAWQATLCEFESRLLHREPNDIGYRSHYNPEWQCSNPAGARFGVLVKWYHAEKCPMSTTLFTNRLPMNLLLKTIPLIASAAMIACGSEVELPLSLDDAPVVTNDIGTCAIDDLPGFWRTEFTRIDGKCPILAPRTDLGAQSFGHPIKCLVTYWDISDDRCSAMVQVRCDPTFVDNPILATALFWHTSDIQVDGDLHYAEGPPGNCMSSYDFQSRRVGF